MTNTQTSSFGLYETNRILIPGFYFTSLALLFYLAFISHYTVFNFETLWQVIGILFLIIVSGFTMYAKETTKRRRAFIENQPSAFLQEVSRRHSTVQALNETEARQLYLFILNNHISSTFHDKIFFFGTVYHIMIQIRRTSFLFAVFSIICVTIQSAMGINMADQQGLIVFCLFVCLIYLLNVKYNKADRNMQDNYQDQIFWLKMNEPLIKELLQKYDKAKKVTSA